MFTNEIPKGYNSVICLNKEHIESKPIIKHDMFLWKEIAPPINTWIWGKYDLNDKHKLLLTCEKGCCVKGILGPQFSPIFWKIANQKDGEEEIKNWKPFEPFY